MVMTLLNLTDEPQEDAGDALAIAICHLHSMSPVPELAPKPI
jgi:Holliday junction resolvasome RuvABC endonuclease subunit